MITDDLSPGATSQETRRTIRTNILKGARVTWQTDTRREVSRISDLSLSGLFIETTEPPETGTPIDLSWEAPGREMHAHATVRRSIPGQGMGVEFKEMGAEDLARLLSLLRAAAEQELSKKTGPAGNPAIETNLAQRTDNPVHPAQEAGKPSTVPAVPPPARLSERRTNLRHKVAGIVEVVEAESGQRVKGHLGDLGRSGCYVKTQTPSPIGTAVNVHITRASQSLRASAKAVYSIPGKGMGLLFTALGVEELRVLESWLEAAVETSWLESNRRRSQRIVLAINVQVAGRTRLGEQFKEPTQTVSVSPSGALVLVSKRIEKGQQVLLRNVRTQAEMECSAVYVAKAPNDQYEVRLSFLLPNRAFWGVVFPPVDWSARHPDAKKGT